MDNEFTMNILRKPKTVSISHLVPYADHPFPIYEGERLGKLVNSIREIGLQNPIIVRTCPNEKSRFEILSGHNRAEAARLLGWSNISAVVRDDLSDEMAERIVLESNLNQQSFSDWKYSQQIKVIKRYNKYIHDNSQQGKRSDLESGDSTCVHSEHKSSPQPKRPKSRDKISKQLGISPTVFERYRSIAKLGGDTIDTICKLLDDKRIGFMVAYRISQLKDGEISIVVEYLNDNPTFKLTGAIAKSIFDNSKISEHDLTNIEVNNMLLQE